MSFPLWPPCGQSPKFECETQYLMPRNFSVGIPGSQRMNLVDFGDPQTSSQNLHMHEILHNRLFFVTFVEYIHAPLEKDPFDLV